MALKACIEHSYLSANVDKTLCGVLDLVINEFLCEAFKNYEANNSSVDSNYKMYNIPRNAGLPS